MKARIKETGEIVKVENLYDDGTAEIVLGGSVGYMKVSMLDFFDNDSNEIDWEQRRYEIAKGVLASFMSNSNSNVYGGSSESQAKYAIEYADALIEQLKKIIEKHEKYKSNNLLIPPERLYICRVTIDRYRLKDILLISYKPLLDV